MKINLIVVLLLTVLAAACEDPAANKPKAETSEPATSTSAGNANAVTDANAGIKPTGTALYFSDADSKVEFTGSKVTGLHNGGFRAFKGTIDLVDEKAEASKVTVDIDMNSVFTDADGLTKHLQTDDFFAVQRFPRASFVSTMIEPDGKNGSGKYKVTGDLELRGVRKSVKFPATIIIGKDDVTVKAEFAINRKDFGILYAGKADDLIRDDVVIKLDLKPSRK